MGPSPTDLEQKRSPTQQFDFPHGAMRDSSQKIAETGNFWLNVSGTESVYESMPPVISLKNVHRLAPERDCCQEDRLVDRILLRAYRLCWWNPETEAALQLAQSGADALVPDTEPPSRRNLC